jgi:hypothetical protein
MALSSACLPAGDIGGLPSVPRQIASGEKESCCVGMKFFRVENAAILGAVHIEAIFLSEFGDDGFGDAQLAAGSLHHGVFEPRRFRENQNGFLFGREQALRQR